MQKCVFANGGCYLTKTSKSSKRLSQAYPYESDYDILAAHTWIDVIFFSFSP